MHKNNMEHYLSTEQAAAYLGIKERKLYELVAAGGVPCSKVTGKWLFPRAALDRWVEAGLVRPAGFQPLQPPPIIGGSHDLLLEWAARHSGSGLALLPEGSSNGLSRLDRNEVAIAAIHMHTDAAGADESANVEAVLAMAHLHDGVVVAFGRREQGLIVAPDRGVGETLEQAVATARFGMRQQGAGAQLLLAKVLAGIGRQIGDIQAASARYATDQDLAFAIRTGDIDCGVATRAVALANGLGFVPLVQERFDLVLRRRSYFEPGPQRLFALMRDAAFGRQAQLFGGYDVSAAGTIVLNR